MVVDGVHFDLLEVKAMEHTLIYWKRKLYIKDIGGEYVQFK